MQPEHMALMIPLVGMVTLFIGLPWLVLHYISKFRENRGLNQADERMLEDLWRSARDISRRLEAVEHILDVKTPGAERTGHDR